MNGTARTFVSEDSISVFGAENFEFMPNASYFNALLHFV